jgi:TPR repeat protein
MPKETHDSAGGLEKETLDKKTIQIIKSLAKQGDADAQRMLGMMYLHGKGVSKSEAEACEWFEKAADQGNADAQCDLGTMYRNGLGVKKNEVTAFTWWKKAADQGYAMGQYGLGNMYLYGLGVIRSKAKACELWEKAAKQGHADAQCDLGKMYLYGLGVIRSKAKAHELWEEAARQGHADAQFILGNRGSQGVKKDEVKAVNLLKETAKIGLFANAYLFALELYSSVLLDQEIDDEIAKQYLDKSIDLKENNKQEFRSALTIITLPILIRLRSIKYLKYLIEDRDILEQLAPPINLYEELEDGLSLMDKASKEAREYLEEYLRQQEVKSEAGTMFSDVSQEYKDKETTRKEKEKANKEYVEAIAAKDSELFEDYQLLITNKFLLKENAAAKILLKKANGKIKDKTASQKANGEIITNYIF